MRKVGADVHVKGCSGITGLACSDMCLTYSTNSNKTTRMVCVKKVICDKLFEISPRVLESVFCTVSQRNEGTVKETVDYTAKPTVVSDLHSAERSPSPPRASRVMTSAGTVKVDMNSVGRSSSRRGRALLDMGSQVVGISEMHTRSKRRTSCKAEKERKASRPSPG